MAFLHRFERTNFFLLTCRLIQLNNHIDSCVKISWTWYANPFSSINVISYLSMVQNFKSGEDGFTPSPQRALFHQEVKQEFMERKDRTKELELDLLLAENKQLRAKVSLLTFEKQSALNMYNQERKRNQVLYSGEEICIQPSLVLLWEFRSSSAPPLTHRSC